MIQLEYIKKTYGESVIFRDFSLEIQDGEWIELCGNSGVGKTTLLQMMMGFVCQDQGRILGVPKKISAVFQENRLFETFSVRKNLWLASPKESEKKRLEILKAMELFTYADQNVETLSGGQRRRVAIAMMLARNADLYVLDEAFQGLDDEIKEKVMQTVKESLTGKTAIFVTHSESERAFFGGRKVELLLTGNT
jgi:sulfate/thiosulfate ABC transporter, ATP-binding protein